MKFLFNKNLPNRDDLAIGRHKVALNENKMEFSVYKNKT